MISLPLYNPYWLGTCSICYLFCLYKSEWYQILAKKVISHPESILVGNLLRLLFVLSLQKWMILNLSQKSDIPPPIQFILVENLLWLLSIQSLQKWMILNLSQKSDIPPPIQYILVGNLHWWLSVLSLQKWMILNHSQKAIPYPQYNPSWLGTCSGCCLFCLYKSEWYQILAKKVISPPPIESL